MATRYRGLMIWRLSNEQARGNCAHVRPWSRIRRIDAGRRPQGFTIEAAAADGQHHHQTLNEERYIASEIESALASLREIDGEVILADRGSTDRFPRLAPA
jgi:hypothetical protein